MALRFSIFLVPLVIAAVATLLLAVFAVRHREKRTAPQVVGILVGSGLWAGADAVSLASTNQSVMVFFHNVRLVGSTVLVFSVIVFALEYTNRERWLRRPYVAALLAPFLVTVVLAWTDPALVEHGLVRTSVDEIETAGLVVADYTFGPWFWVNAVYSYGLLLVALAFYVIELIRKDASTYRKQTAALVVATLVPWFMNGLYLVAVTPVDLTGAGLAVTGSLFYASLFWFSLLDLIPIARGTVLDHIEHGVLVVDTDGRIVDCNRRMTEFVGLSRDALVGSSFQSVYADYPELVERFEADRDTRGTVSMDRDGEVRHYEVEYSPIYSRTDRYLGRTLVVRDVTDRVRRERALRRRTEQLETQNERLDEFASIVSHDLRNPLNVAQGYLDIAAEQSDLPELDEVRESHERMEELVEDVLALARSAEPDTEVEPVELSEVVEEAWRNVDAPEGTLVVITESTIEADRGRLCRLFENLFRNSFDHGPADATITVGNLDAGSGFFVEDDGPGIDCDDRETVFEEGFTTADDGTGLGLAIVRSVADGHDWSVRLTDGRNGGARFEFAGVSTVAHPDA